MAPAKKAPAKKAADAKPAAKRPLTAYQKFVKLQFPKVGTSTSTAPEKIKLIASLWKKEKK